jgi:hypothetical protein
LYREPADWILCTLVFGVNPYADHFRVGRISQFLASPDRYVTGLFGGNLGDTQRDIYYPVPADLASAEEVMSEITVRIKSEAIPFFDQLSTIDKFGHAIAEQIVSDPPSARNYEHLFYVRLLQHDLPAAFDAAAHATELVNAELAQGEIEWATELRDHITRTVRAAERDWKSAVEILRQQAATTRRNIGIRR